MLAALDTNLLVYAEGFGDVQRVSATRALLEQLSDADLVVPLQCLGELFRVLTGKGPWISVWRIPAGVVCGSSTRCWSLLIPTCRNCWPESAQRKEIALLDEKLRNVDALE